ncbi:hypothetical protein EDB89DRAFT_1912177 [Lactarius sanguifluus]|nr:hypothetical protein EDB89DRAFT_1912177 [Lactarius sanguifluus]
MYIFFVSFASFLTSVAGPHPSSLAQSPPPRVAACKPVASISILRHAGVRHLVTARTTRYGATCHAKTPPRKSRHGTRALQYMADDQLGLGVHFKPPPPGTCEKCPPALHLSSPASPPPPPIRRTQARGRGSTLRLPPPQPCHPKARDRANRVRKPRRDPVPSQHANPATTRCHPNTACEPPHARRAAHASPLKPENPRRNAGHHGTQATVTTTTRRDKDKDGAQQRQPHADEDCDDNHDRTVPVGEGGERIGAAGHATG